MKQLHLLSIAFVLVATSSCALLTGAEACDGDANCPAGEVCVDDKCVVGNEGEGEGEEGEGEEGEGEEGEGEGEGEEGEGEEGEGEGEDPCPDRDGTTIDSNGDDPYAGLDCVDVTGDIVISGANINETALNGLQTVRSIAGNLEISSDAAQLDDVELVGLETMTGGLLVTSTRVGTLSLPSLREAGGVLLNDNDELVSVDLSSLETVNGDVVVLGNSSLDQLDVSSLVTVVGDINATNNDELCVTDIEDIEAGLTDYDGTTTNDLNEDEPCN